MDKSCLEQGTHKIDDSISFRDTSDKSCLELGTHKIIEALITRRIGIEKELVRLEKDLERAPEGRLRICKNRVRHQYYQCVCSAGRKGKYIPDASVDLAKALAQKDYDSKLMTTLRGEKNAICEFLQNFHPEQVDEVFRSLREQRKPLVIPIRLPDEDYVKQWLSVVYEKMGFASDAPEYLTARNERVRSKSEIMIADALARNLIVFRYEYPIQIEGLGCVHPDFICLHPVTRQGILWEHFGMMDDPSYADQTTNKIEKYCCAGYHLGCNLIATFETSKHPLLSRHIEQKIQRHFR
jgi:hypothetical protein